MKGRVISPESKFAMFYKAEVYLRVVVSDSEGMMSRKCATPGQAAQTDPPLFYACK